VGHGDRKKNVQSLYLSVNDADLPGARDRIRFDKGETEILVNIESSKTLERQDGSRKQNSNRKPCALESCVTASLNDLTVVNDSCPPTNGDSPR
jgi:hypothetical protein